jgi:hypothetical protein
VSLSMDEMNKVRPDLGQYAKQPEGETIKFGTIHRYTPILVQNQESEIFSIEGNGDIILRGTVIANDKEVAEILAGTFGIPKE